MRPAPYRLVNVRRRTREIEYNTPRSGFAMTEIQRVWWINSLLALTLLGALLGCVTPPNAVRVDDVDITIGGHTADSRALRSPPSDTPRTQLLASHFEEWRGVRHRYGGLSKRGIDCSGFVQVTYAHVFNLNLPRSTKDQVKFGKGITPYRLAAGDLVFFKIGWRQRHVGIYIGNNQFIHASSKRGVAKSSLASPYWSKRFWKARRPLTL